jgi:hypothetical protein
VIVLIPITAIFRACLELRKENLATQDKIKRLERLLLQALAPFLMDPKISSITRDISFYFPYNFRASTAI